LRRIRPRKVVAAVNKYDILRPRTSNREIKEGKEPKVRVKADDRKTKKAS
jgi:hypothetical protein